jgi:hypothetical protein
MEYVCCVGELCVMACGCRLNGDVSCVTSGACAAVGAELSTSGIVKRRADESSQSASDGGEMDAIDCEDSF